MGNAGGAIRAVVLDAMGVMYRATDDVAHRLVPFAAQVGCRLTLSEIRGLYIECSLGRISTAELWSSLGVHGEAGDLDAAYLRGHALMPGLVEFLERMQSRGILLGCITNDVAEWSLHLRRLHGLEVYLSCWTVSGEVGVRKPDLAIFRHFLDTAGIAAPECLFVDDRVANLDAARLLGFRTGLFHVGPQAPGESRHPVATGFDQVERWV